jgi:hypothetical protein
MNTSTLIILLIQEALQILQIIQIGGQTAEIEKALESLLKIISIAKTAYEQQVGKPLDVNLIKPYEPLL